MNNFFLKLEKIFNILVSDKYQKYLKRINSIAALFCIVYISNIYYENKINLNLLISINISELFLLVLANLFSMIMWIKYMNFNYGSNTIYYLANWSYSKIGKYFPVGILTFSIRLNQEFKKNSSSKKIFTGLLEEQFLGPITLIPALVFYFLSFPFQKSIYLFYFYILISVYIVKKTYYKIFKPNNSLLDFSFLLSLTHFSMFLFILQISLRSNFELPILISILYFLATSLSNIFVGVPAGIGIREFIFLFITNNYLSNLDLVNFIFEIRLALITVDFLIAIFGFIFFNFKYKNN